MSNMILIISSRRTVALEQDIGACFRVDCEVGSRLPIRGLLTLFNMTEVILTVSTCFLASPTTSLHLTGIARPICQIGHKNVKNPREHLRCNQSYLPHNPGKFLESIAQLTSRILSCDYVSLGPLIRTIARYVLRADDDESYERKHGRESHEPS